MIIVTGGSGKLGRAIVERLLERVDAARIGVSVRDPKKVDELSRRGVRVRQGDFNDASSLRAAFEGASQVLLVSSNAGAFGGDPVAQHRTAIAAARDAGVRRILYTSHQAASSTSAFGPARAHAATEALLEASTIPFTSLRNGFYATTVSHLLGDAAKTGEWRAPAGGKASWTAPADLAEAAAIIASSEEGRFDGPVTLTASEAVDLAEIATIASELAGRAIELVTVTDDEHRASLLARGTPPGAVELLLSIFTAMRKGELDRVDPTLERVLGRKPTTVREVLAGVG
jgi:NAD(P)H dehydrogenase (quinone)